MLGELITAIEGREWVARGSCDVDLVYENKKELEELEIVKKTQKQKQKQKKQSKQVVDKEGEENEEENDEGGRIELLVKMRRFPVMMHNQELLNPIDNYQRHETNNIEQGNASGVVEAGRYDIEHYCHFAGQVVGWAEVKLI